jgi:uroporphyrin-III C-methyltransferase / precorrin-2 dehydrogenase / sirohydrochlorin ferrochelatase
MTLAALPIFVKLDGRAVILIGEGEAGAAKRRLLERARAVIVGEDGEAALAIVALADPDGVAVRLKARGILVNVADRPELCDFTLPAIVDRSPVVVAIGTGGASAGLAAALRQRIETLLPATLGELARALGFARGKLRERWPDAGERRRAIGTALGAGGTLDPMLDHRADAVGLWIAGGGEPTPPRLERIVLASADPDDLTLAQARLLGSAERLFHSDTVPTIILDRARADAVHILATEPPAAPGDGLSVWLEMAR